MRTHTVSGICVALCAVAKAMKQNHSSRNFHFAQRTLNSTSHPDCEISDEILSFLTSEHIPTPLAVSPELFQTDCNENDLFPLQTDTRTQADMAP